MRNQIHVPTWIPATGDRVKIRLSHECKHGRYAEETGKLEAVGHFAEEDGKIGTVFDYPSGYPVRNGHDVAVALDHYIEVKTISKRPALFVAGAYFAGELEPIRSEISVEGAYFAGELELLKEGDDNA